MSALTKDLRFAWRRLGKSPGFATAAILMLGLGIGASVAMFSVLQGVVLSGLPYPGGERVVAVSAANAEQDSTGSLTPAEAVRLERGESPYEAFGFYNWGGITFSDGDKPREATIIIASAGFFPALGVQPMLGRTFTKEDMGEEQGAIILSYTEWQRLTGGDKDAVGKLIDTIDNGRLQIVGVMPPEFAYPASSVGAWRPMRDAYLQPDKPGYWNSRGFVYTVGRIAEGVSPALALERTQAIMDEVREHYRMRDTGWRVSSMPLLEEAIGGAHDVLWASFGVAVLVLLIACANVAILLDARQIARRHEQSIAQALGASRARVYRVMLIELGLLGLAGAALGTLFATGALELLKGLAEGSVPRVEEIGLDAGVLLFALLVGLATPMLAAALGSLRLRGQPIDAMRGGAKGAAPMQARRTRLLPVLGVALSTMALFAAAAMVASLVRVQDVDPGFAADNIHAMQMFRDGGPSKTVDFADALQAKLRAMPGVTHVALTTAAPLSLIGSFTIDLAVPGRERPEPLVAGLRRVSPDYLDALSIPVREGRNFTAEDRAGGELVAIINQSLAKRVFGEESAIGQIIALPLGERDRIQYRVVGVTADVRNDGLRSDASGEILIPFVQSPWVGMTFLVRTAVPLPGLAQQIREAMWEVDPNEAPTREFTMRGELDDQLRPAQFFARAVGGFALCALLLAALGVYALAAQHQQQRRSEFGLRLAIGAPPARLARQSLGDSLRGGLLGIVLGAAVGFVLLRLLQAQLFEFGGGYAPWFALAALGIGLAVVAAALPPALRASRIDPMTALRDE